MSQPPISSVSLSGFAFTEESETTLAECPPGLFVYNGSLCFKSEYRTPEGLVEAFTVESGEFFWGGAESHRARESKVVKPIKLLSTAAEPKPTPPDEAVRQLDEQLAQQNGRLRRIGEAAGMSFGAWDDVEQLATGRINLLKGLIDLCGYVQDGSDQIVMLFQDDATREWIVKVGQANRFRSYWAGTPEGAITIAIGRETDPES